MSGGGGGGGASCDGGGGGGGSYSWTPRAGLRTRNSPAREAREGLRASAPLARLQSRCCSGTDSRLEGSEAGLAGVYVGLGGASNAVQLVEAGQPTGGLSVTRARRAIAEDLPELAAVDAGPRSDAAAGRDSGLDEYELNACGAFHGYCASSAGVRFMIFRPWGSSGETGLVHTVSIDRHPRAESHER